jgi:predicted nucleic acid-binding protein
VILVETSAWVEYDRATGSQVDQAVKQLLHSGGMASTEPVLMEVMAGARSDEAATTLRRLLTSFKWIPTDPVADFEGAGDALSVVYSRWYHPHGLIDCMIASIAMRSGAELVTADRDFEEMARVVPLRLVAT